MKTIVKTVRGFNRFYTNILGLLEQHMLESSFSLSEIRVLYEIAYNENCTSSDLSKLLKMDKGYLSRILKTFENKGMVSRKKAVKDGRIIHLALTSTGQEVFNHLEELSEAQVESMVSHLSSGQQQELEEHLKRTKALMTQVEDEITIDHNLEAGDVGALISLHGRLYAKECGYNYEFEGYVCKTFYDFLQAYTPEKDRIWLVRRYGQVLGAIAIVGYEREKAQLRWFVLAPEIRGKGLGRQLLGEAIAYCKQKSYREVFLVTTSEQEQAIKMYTQMGFSKVTEERHLNWGKEIIDQTYVLEL